MNFISFQILYKLGRYGSYEIKISKVRYLPRLLWQNQFWPGDVGIRASGRNSPQLDRHVAGPTCQQAVVERRKGEIGDGVAVTVDSRNGGLVGTAARGERQNGQAGAQRVPVEDHVGGAGGDVVAARVIGACQEKN